MTFHELDISRRIELERADAARQALEEAAKKTESLVGNPHYRAAFKLAARTIRAMKFERV